MKETKKQIKAQLINEIAAQYAKREKSLKERIGFLAGQYKRAMDRVSDLEKENIELREKVEQYEDWIERLQEFVGMDPDSRDKAIAQFKVRAETDAKLNKVLDLCRRFF